MGGVVLAGGDLQLMLGGRYLVRLLEEEQAVCFQLGLKGAWVSTGGKGSVQLCPGNL
jgi:hypothetical protein